MTISATRSKR